MRAGTYEMGDFAANSLLIQDAKSFSLLVGNYSRVGFNHPGPAILYVLAAGEYVLFDTLHWVDYAFSGQLIAVACYNAFWLLMIALLLRRMRISRPVVLFAVSIFCLVSAIEDHSFFNGIWFPHLYFFPFAVLLLSLARLLQEKADSLWILAVSTGFLINGHASFIAILGLMLITVLAYSFFCGAQRGGILHPSFIKANRRPLVVAFLLLALFFVPMLILTVRDFPGPIGEYAEFGGGHKPNKLKDAISFVALYWGGGTGFSVALIACALLWTASRKKSSLSITRSFLVVILAATLAMLFYARYGVDYLNQTYIGLFYFAVPSVLSIAAIVFALHDYSGRRYVMPLSIIASLVALLIGYSFSSRPPFYLDQYQGLQIKELYEALAKEKGSGGRLVLDLDDSNDWPHVWMVVVGAGAYTKRQGDDLFCVNNNWYISFSKKLRCTSEEVSGDKRFVVRRSVQNSARIPSVDLGGVSFFKYAPPTSLMPGALTIKTDRNLFTDYLLGSGWTAPDELFAWSVGHHAVIEFPPVPTGAKIILELGAFLPLPDSHQRVVVQVNGKEQTSAEFSASAARQKVEIRPSASDGKAMQITLQIDTPISPASLGGSLDTRQLGVALYGIDVILGSTGD